MIDYWQQQSATEPLFPDTLWSKPENKTTAGKLGIVGGNALSFLAVANAYQTAVDTGIGEIKLVLPEDLKKQLGNLVGTEFAPTNQSGGLSKEAEPILRAMFDETDGTLLVGDTSRNNETQLLYENFIRQTNSTTSTKPIAISRDAVDLLMGIMNEIVIRDNVVLVLSFAQLQKIFQTVYFPIVLIHSIQTIKLVEALHKFTIANGATLAVFHDDTFVVASKGQVMSTPFGRPTELWQGKTPAKIACWSIWNHVKPIEAIACALLDK